MSTRLRVAGRRVLLIAGIAFLGVAAVADGIAPVTLKLKEQESNRFLAQWRVPKQLPPTAIPSAVFPDSCRSVGERSVTERPGAWFVRQAYLCSEGLSGRSLGVEYPFPNATVSTVLRVEMLSGDRYAHILAPGKQSWRVPAATAGDARAWYRAARQAVLGGAEHFVDNGVHVALALALVLLGGFAGSVRLATAFAAGQLVAVAVFSVTGLQLSAALAEIGVAAAVALLAREVLRPPEDRRQLVAVVACAGLAHGLGLAHLISTPADYDGSSMLFYGLVVIGMDATLLLVSVVVLMLGQLLPRPLSRRVPATVAAYTVAVGAIALTLGFPAVDSANAGGDRRTGIQLPDLPIPEGSGTPTSKRVAQPYADAAMQSFVTVAPFEVRHEVLVRLREVASRVGLDPTGDLGIDAQDEIKRRVQELVGERTTFNIDGRVIEPAGRRVDFLGIGARGALPRLDPIPEPVDEAWLGVTAVYVTDRTPREVVLTWEGIDARAAVPATVTDPESSQSVELTPRRPALRWTNELSEDPTPVVTAIAIEPPTLWVPLLSLVLIGTAIGLVVAALRSRSGKRSQSRGREVRYVLARLAFAAAFLLAPVADVAFPLPAAVSSTPDAAGAKRILARVLPNVYRSFEFPTESTVYDRLALSVTGETLTDVYLGHRRSVMMEERGGAKASVEAVEVVEVSSVEPGADGGFVAETAWTVAGTVTHFGHRHFRQNRYDARVAVVPVDDHWKIRSIEVLDEKRLR